MFRALIAAGVIALAGCGAPSDLLASTSPQATTGDLTAMTTQGLMQGWDQIHQAIFNMIDVKHQGFIDQDEAGPYIPLDAFDAMDKAHEGKINYQQFMAYATQGGFLESSDSPSAFMERTRKYLQIAFDKLNVVPGSGGFLGLFPKPGDGYLSERQLSKKYVSALGMAFTYPRLNIQVQINAFKRADFKAADKLGLGKLTIGEFEDLYIATVCELITAIPTHGHHGKKKFSPVDPTTDPSTTSVGNDPGNTAIPSVNPSSNAYSSYDYSSSDAILITTDDYNPQDDIQIDQ